MQITRYVLGRKCSLLVQNKTKQRNTMNSKFSRQIYSLVWWVTEEHERVNFNQNTGGCGPALLTASNRDNTGCCIVFKSVLRKPFSLHCIFCELLQSMECTPRGNCHSYIFAVTSNTKSDCSVRLAHRCD